ncbi:MAG: DNA polymerase III subunit beta [Puniceicoccales bacterium]|jgi:DNA polymerase-3 subunit beta|nr:DNA polymerase III subunit beta [Puniceicoccales bacterium]
MKFSIEKTTFVNGLQQVLSVVEQRAIIPVLSNVLLECANDGLKITATSLDISIHCQVKAEIEMEGKITLPARKLAAIVRSLPGDTVVAELVGTTVKISSGRSNFQIMGLSADDFPTTNEPSPLNKAQLQQAEMAKMLRNVSFAQSNDDSRFILNSVYFCFDQNKLTFAATDGRRLSLVSREIAENIEDIKGVIIPSKTIREIERLLGQGEDVAFLFDNRQIVFLIAVDKENQDGLIGDIKVVSKIVEGNYPNFRQIIPQGAENRVKLDRQLTLECIQRVAIVANDQKNLVKLRFENNALEISAESQEYGNAHEKIAIVYEGKPIEIAFNHVFICDPLKVLTQDEVFFEFKDELSAGVFKTLEDFLYVVMPLRMG